MSAAMIRTFEQAWNTRRQAGHLEKIHDSALRLYCGPGEVHPREPLASWAVDGYGKYLWVTEWEEESAPATVEEIRDATQGFYSREGYLGAVVLRRLRQGIPEMPQLLWGEAPPASFNVVERADGHEMKFEIQLLEGRHPGLFLDHAPLRRWLACSGKVTGKKVLNTFAYTGSLSVASWMGGASEVVTLDLSRPTTQWAERNGRMNGIPPDKSRYIYGDFFEDVPRFVKRSDFFDVVISDPPSFSRGKKRTFSTQKDLVDLHELLLSVLRPGGILVTSINSANVAWEKYERDVQQAARKLGRKLKLLGRIEQPDTFPSHPANPKSRYLKGFIFES
jgi:23S rRNA G2069 N7-methylase RlmK/C1962 C5-methylase RlmI